jgi:hypothetical protein
MRCIIVLIEASKNEHMGPKVSISVQEDLFEVWDMFETLRNMQHLAL